MKAVFHFRLILKTDLTVESSIVYPSQDYRARKAERLKKRISSQIQESLKQSESNTSAVSDLLQVIGAPSEKRESGKGSRFTHAEKLQFAKVCFIPLLKLSSV